MGEEFVQNIEERSWSEEREELMKIYVKCDLQSTERIQGYVL